MAPAQGRENVAVFTPIVLALPNWHPDGPDGDVDGYVIPFVMPEDRLTNGHANRDAKIAVHQSAGYWRAVLRGCQDHAETGDQARALAGAWIRAAEVLDNVAKATREADMLVDDTIVDGDDGPVEDDGCRCNSFDGNCPEHGPR